MSKPLRITLFSGGRGTASIARTLNATPNVALTCMINGYDDGQSTGLVRSLAPDMLGPSDFRKAFANLLQVEGPGGKAISKLLEARFDYRHKTEYDYLRHAHKDLIESMSYRQGECVRQWWSRGVELMGSVKLDGVAVGNVLFLGAFDNCGRNFNHALDSWNSVFCTQSQILNVTDGKSLYLCALLEDGEVLPDEASIVADRQSTAAILKTFLLERPMSRRELDSLVGKSLEQKSKHLAQLSVAPEPSSCAIEAIASADLIVFGPGTQHSSLLPSYLTRKIGDAIGTAAATKVLISNLSEDFDAPQADIPRMIEAVVMALNTNAESIWSAKDLIDLVMVNWSEGASPWGLPRGDLTCGPTIWPGPWSIDGAKHDGKRVTGGLITVAGSAGDGRGGSHSPEGFERVSVVVPVLDEVKTIDRVLVDLVTFDWFSTGLAVEILVVDGGSTDGTLEILQTFPGIRVLRSDPKSGRGGALCLGLREATSDLMVTFPADGEYLVHDILKLVKALKQIGPGLVFGSRSIKYANTDELVKTIYQNNRREYLVSKWGGFVLSLIVALMYRRWLSDPLTSIKGIHGDALTSMTLRGQGLQPEMSLITDAWRNTLPIAEVPVDYVPRMKIDGKKMNIKLGLGAIWALVRGRFA
jgi:2-phospho-L-lactate transferase/gluconeogenesis factor (CofD/UPF0052 family)